MSDVETSFVRSPRGWIAHQVIGDGPHDVVVVKLNAFPVDLMWEEPTLVRFLNGLSSFSRHIWFDPRGSGASDALDDVDDRLLESTVDDIVSVIDHVGCEEVTVLGLVGGPALMFAATHPRRVRRLILVSPTASIRARDGVPGGMPADRAEALLAEMSETWGSGALLRFYSASLMDDPRFSRWAARCERLNTSHEHFDHRLRATFDTDIRSVLPSVRVPVSVVYRSGAWSAQQSQYVARAVGDSDPIALAGTETSFLAGDVGALLDAVETRVTGGVTAHDDDRVLVTVMFTDVVGSTERVAEEGDRRWRTTLATHDMVVRREITRARGREVKMTGDGFLATFDGPGRAVRCAGAIRDALHGVGIDVRVGLHVGEVELRGDDVSGIAVHIAQRVQSAAKPGEILATSTVRDLVAGSGIVFEDRGTSVLRGIPDPWHVFAAQP